MSIALHDLELRIPFCYPTNFVEIANKVSNFVYINIYCMYIYAQWKLQIQNTLDDRTLLFLGQESGMLK